MRRTAGTCLCTVFMVGCAPPIAYRTPIYNIRVAPTTTPEAPEDIDAVAAAVIEHLAEATDWTEGQLEHAIWGIKLTIEEEPFDCYFVSGATKCWGVANEYGVRYAYHECIASSALPHELIHLLVAKCGLGWADTGHETKDWWGPDSVESRARMDACKAICPELCPNGPHHPQ